MKKLTNILRVLILVPFFIACQKDDPKPIYDMDYNQVLKHLSGGNKVILLKDGTWHWIVDLPDGNRARIDEFTRVDLCVTFKPDFCI